MVLYVNNIDHMCENARQNQFYYIKGINLLK